MTIRPTRWIAKPVLCGLMVGVALAGVGQVSLLSGPTATAQVGVPYSSAVTAQNGTPPYSFAITSGALPPGLNLTPGTGAVAGTPTTAGTYNFQVQVTDSQPLPTDPNSPAGRVDTEAAVRRGMAQSGNSAASVSGGYSITVAPPVANGVPSSPWTIAMVTIGLAGAGFLQLRRTAAQRG